MDPHEEKIVAILRYGPKKKVEIVTLMQNYKADKTTRNRIDDLEERGVIEEEEDSKRLYLSEGEKTMVRPKPFADQEEVNRVLFNIEEELGTIQSDIEEFCSDDSLFDKIITRVGTTRTSNIDTTETSSSFDSLTQFYKISDKRYYVLQNKENMAAFKRIFDHIIDVLNKANEKSGVVRLPDEYFSLFFESVSNIYENWYKGKENDSFDSVISERANRIEDIFEASNSKFDTHLQRLLIHINREKAQSVYISMVKSGNYDPEQLAEEAFYAFDANNEIHELFDNLDEVQSQTEDQQIVSDITDLKERIIRMYTREIQEVTT